MKVGSQYRAPPPRVNVEDNISGIKRRILVCICLNACILYLSTMFFYYLVFPVAKWCFMLVPSSDHAQVEEEYEDFWKERIEPGLDLFKNIVLSMPLFLLSKVVNAVMFQEIADATFRQSKERFRMLPSVSFMISDIILSFVVQILFLGQALVFAKIFISISIPTLGRVLYIFHMSVLNALYSFEYKW